MAFQVKFVFLGICFVVGFLHAAFGSSCYFNSDCGGFGRNYCCGGKCSPFYCSETTTCVLDSDCPGAKYCCASGDCRYNLDNCPLASGSIVGIVVGVLILVIIITALVVSCLCCASCPFYHARRHGGAIIARQPNFQTATVTSSTSSYQPPPQTILPPQYPGPSFSAYPPSNTNTQYTGQYPGPPPTNYP